MRGLLVSLFVVIVLLSPSFNAESGEQADPGILTRQGTGEWAVSMAGVAKTSIVAGIIHNITIPLDHLANNVTLVARTASAFTQGNISNNYSWTYLSGVWTDNLYGYYIDNGSARYGNVYCFHLAVDSTSVTGWWSFAVYADGIWDSAQQYQVVTPQAGISMSAPKFYFKVFPYSAEAISSWIVGNPENSSSVKTENIGNVPTTLTITYDSMNSLFSTTNSTGTYYPGEQKTHFITFQAPEWSPRQITIKGRIHCEPQLLLTPNIVSTLVAPETVFEVVVTVARPGYQIFQMDGVTVQYKSFYSANYSEKLMFDMWFTGNKSISLEQEMEDLTFNDFFFQGRKSTDGLVLILSDTEEQRVAVNVTCSVAPPRLNYTSSLMAYAHFDLTPEDGSAAGRLTSNVVVQPSGGSMDDGALSANLTVLIILIVVFVVIGLFLARAYRKSEEERRRELEDKIRLKKEKARKQRRS